LIELYKQEHQDQVEGFYTSTGNSIHDVVVIYNGKPFIQFNQVSDPTAVVKLVQSAKKH